MIFQNNHGLSVEYWTFENGINLSFPLHLHNCYELIVATSGEFEVNVDNISYMLHKNEAILIFPYQIHEIKTEKESRDTLCIFSGELVPHFHQLAKDNIPANPVFYIKDTDIFDIFASCDNDAPIMKVKGILYLLLSQLCSQTTLAERKNCNNSSLALLLKILLYVNEHYKEECSLKDVSAYLQYEYTYLSQCFTNMLRMSFTEYVRLLRINKACSLLKDTEKKISDIANESGFASARSFERNFAKQMGITPKKYRHQGNMTVKKSQK